LKVLILPKFHKHLFSINFGQADNCENMKLTVLNLRYFCGLS